MTAGRRSTRRGRSPLRVGIIGTGFGGRVVAGAFRDAGCEIVDVVTARDEAAVRELCRSPVDLVAVHSPPFLHRTHVTWAIDAGRAVLCEKPFGLTVDEAAAMTAAARDAGVPNFVNFEFRRQPARQALAELVASGAIGTPVHLSYTAFTSGSRVPLRPWGWLFDRSRGGGWIGAFGSHAIDLIRWVLGDVVRAGASSWITIEERSDPAGAVHRCDAEDAFVGWAELGSGATATVDSTFAASIGVTPRIVVLGSEGSVENIGDRRLVVRRQGVETEHLEFAPPAGDPHAEAMTAWAAVIHDALRTGADTEPSFDDGLACARIMEQWRAVPPVPVGARRQASDPGAAPPLPT